MKTECNFEQQEFQGLGFKKVVGKFDGGNVTSDAGGLLLREVEASRNILGRFARCFTDYRNPAWIEHTVLELIGQRVYGLALGYEDLNDHDVLRRDPLLATLVGKLDPTGQSRKRIQDRGCALGGKSTLNRLELTPKEADETHRYKKIVYEEDAIEQFFVEVFLDSYPVPPKEIILDVDATDDPIHGEQEGRFFHGYYGGYCYLPLYIFCGESLLFSRLRASDIDAQEGTKEALEQIIGQIRQRWPDVKILVRGDSGFARDELMSWCEGNQVDYVFGLAKNARLTKSIMQQMEKVRRKHLVTKESVRCYRDFRYRTLKTWDHKRRVIGKAEYLPLGANPRFIVTSLSKESCDGKKLYEKVYCARGDMENRIKEQQLGLFADRTSSHTMRANQLRLWFSSVAYVLVCELRRLLLSGTEWSKAQMSTIRTKLLKIGAVVTVSVRRVVIQFSSAYPHQKLFASMLRRIKAAPS